EAYVPATDTYIEKDSSINEELDRLRLSATSSLMSREDVIIISSVSCIYNLGDPGEYRNLMVWLAKGKPARRDEILSWLVGIHYSRNDVAFPRGTFRAQIGQDPWSLSIAGIGNTTPTGCTRRHPSFEGVGESGPAPGRQAY
ncbi:MAG: hypothetical protein HYT80_04710, partial [Euryarchaeota archaeon]|nr:hypothetical protein [Euryarchaeota archaeon]